MTSALAIYGTALRRAGTGDRSAIRLVDEGGRTVRAEHAHVWTEHRAGDEAMLDRCTGATLDVGCGPGRLVAALAARGRLALGIDVSAEAVRQARKRGASALHRCVFSTVPGTGRWQHVLLADGNIGIDGDPARLLHRCRSLLHESGDILVEADPPGSPTWHGSVRLTDGDRLSNPFPWAAVALDELPRYAMEAQLRVLESFHTAGRWFARLATL